MRPRTSLHLLLPPALLLPLVWSHDRAEIPLDDARVFVEWNSTDMDFGIQLFWDGEAWSRMRVHSPDERTILQVKASRNLAQQGLTEGFFESAEPPASVLSMEEFFARFPEGTYEFEGRTLEGDELEGEAEFSHVLAAPPGNLYPPQGSTVSAFAPLVLSFDAVSVDVMGEPLEPAIYHVILENNENEGLSLAVSLRGDLAAPAVTVPPEFLEPGTEYKLEVIVEAENGNRTIAETEFSTL
jgi:hypothetical protein